MYIAVLFRVHKYTLISVRTCIADWLHLYSDNTYIDHASP